MLDNKMTKEVNKMNKMQQDIKDGKVIVIRWSFEDVMHRDTSLTEEEAIKILAIIAREHDATLGVNWDVIDCHIQMFHDEK